MSEVTPRLRLPLLAAGQAQKEIAHNEALTLLDLAAQPSVEAAGTTVPPGAPQAGQAWIVGAGATGAWSGQGGRIGLWTAGGWRFVDAPEGARVWVKAGGTLWRKSAAGWIAPASVPGPSGGGVIDGEARATLGAVLAALRQAGLIAA